MNAERFRVSVKNFPKYGKKWVNVRIWDAVNWVPSFHDLFRIIQAICYCEDIKYPTGEGREMVRRFLVDAVAEGADWDELKAKYQIPDRRQP